MSVAAPVATALVVAAIGTPLLLALLVVARPRVGGWPLVVAPLPALLASLALAAGAGVELPWLLFGARFGLDDTGRVLLFAASAVWLAAALHAATGSGLRGRAARAGFLLAMAGHFGAVLAQDAGSFFAAYALMSFAAYPLIVEEGDAAARRAGTVYIALVVLGEVLVLSGLVLLAGSDAGSGSMVVAAGTLLWLGFGIKAGLVPLHVSLPLAYGAAPTAAAIALAGAMVNAGLLGWLRFLPVGAEGAEGLGLLMIAAGLFGALYGVVVGVTQRSARILLGYSSVSQMGLMAVGVGAGLVAPAAWPALLAAVLFYAVQHGFAKAALFAGLGAARGRSGWLAWGLLLIPALALVGLPFTSGALAKAALKGALPALPAPWPSVLEIGLPLAAVGTTLLMARFLVLAVPTSGAAAPAGRRGLGYAALLLGVLTVGWWLPGAFALAVPPLPGATPDSLWPGLLGAAIAAAVLWAGGHGARLSRIAVPPGDWLVPLERLVAPLWRAVLPPADHHHGAAPAPPPRPAPPGRGVALLGRGEAQLVRWDTAVLLVLVVAVLVIAALLAARA